MDLSVDEARQNGRAVFVGVIHDLTDAKSAALAVSEGTARAARRHRHRGRRRDSGERRRAVILTFNPACETLFGYGRAKWSAGNVEMLAPAPCCGEHEAPPWRISVHRRAQALSASPATSPAGARTARSFPSTCRSARRSRRAARYSCASCTTSPSAIRWALSWCRRRRWRASANSRAASRTTSTIC